MKKYKGRARKILAFALVFSVLMVFSMLPASASSVSQKNSNAQINFTPGQLLLSHVPDINFGSHALPSAHTYFAAQSIGPTPLTIADARSFGASAPGWKLQAKLTSFQNSGTTMLGAAIYFNTATSHIKPQTGMPAGIPSPTAAFSKVISGGSAVDVVKSAAGRGYGVWLIDWQGDTTNSVSVGTSTGKDVEIEVFGATTKLGTSTAQLTWDLIDAP